VFPGEPRRVDFAFDATFTETARNQNTRDILELAVDAALQRFGIDQFQDCGINLKLAAAWVRDS
jgi:hypothetical protein